MTMIEHITMKGWWPNIETYHPCIQNNGELRNKSQQIIRLFYCFAISQKVVRAISQEKSVVNCWRTDM